MIVSQNYAKRSEASVEGNQFKMNMATEQSRPSVRLDATIMDGQAYARLMQTLYNVVTGDLRSQIKDNTAYQEWVQQRYMDELNAARAEGLKKLPGWLKNRGSLQDQQTDLFKKIQGLTTIADAGDFDKAKRKYFNYLYTQDIDGWMVLDPVVSVHPDYLIFEAFSKDESSYGRVSVPMNRLEQRGQTQYGTTNIDFSPALAREIARIRSYRPTNLDVGPMSVGLATDAGAVVEKKIDLPPTWVRGFLQVQSAGTLPGLDVRLSASTLADILTELKRKREDKGPRSLRFILTPGQKTKILIEPWGVVIEEPYHNYEGKQAEEVRIWGRRRLLVLDALMAYATDVRIRLLGTGMPTYWSVFQQDLRFDMGLSGWTQNDWSRAAQFDLLASTGKASKDEMVKTAEALQNKLFGTTEVIALQAGLSRDVATTALQQLCREGRAMYDHVAGTYRWRQLFPFMDQIEEAADDPRLNAARRIIEKNGVKWARPPLYNAPPPHQSQTEIVKSSSVSLEFERKNADGTTDFWHIGLEGKRVTNVEGKVGQPVDKHRNFNMDWNDFQTAKENFDSYVQTARDTDYHEAQALTASSQEPAEQGRTRFMAEVQSEKAFNVTIDLDADGRVVYAECTCGTFRRDKLRKGPCPHILATTVMASKEVNREVANVRR